MDQDTESGMTVSNRRQPGGWNVLTGTAIPMEIPIGAQGTILTFTPSTPLAAGTVYTVSWNNTLADTAGNALIAGSFNFTTGSGPDTTTRTTPAATSPTTSPTLGTNFAPRCQFSKPIDPLDINTSTLLMYNYDSGKYINGVVTVAPNGMSATFRAAVRPAAQHLLPALSAWRAARTMPMATT